MLQQVIISGNKNTFETHSNILINSKKKIMEEMFIVDEFEMDLINDEHQMHLIDDFDLSDLSEGSPPSPPRDVNTEGDDNDSLWAGGSAQRQIPIQGEYIPKNTGNMILGFDKNYKGLPPGNKTYEDQMSSFCNRACQGDDFEGITSNVDLAGTFLREIFPMKPGTNQFFQDPPSMTFWVQMKGRPSAKRWSQESFVRADYNTTRQKVKSALVSRLDKARVKKRERIVELEEQTTSHEVGGADYDAPGSMRLTDPSHETQSNTQQWMKIRSCRTVDDFIVAFDEAEGLIHRCLRRIQLNQPNSSTKNVEDWARIWAINLQTGNETACNLDNDRGYCLELLFTLCNPWKGAYNETPTISDSDITDKFMTNRILPILQNCLVMDQAKALYFTTSLDSMTPGINWCPEKHVENNITLDDKNGTFPMNERYFWLLEFDKLKLGPNELPSLHPFAMPMKVAVILGISTTSGIADHSSQIANNRYLSRTICFDGGEWNI
jgi:hypothetical protein